MKTVRIVALGLVGIALGAADKKSDDFCGRLAPQLGMKITKSSNENLQYGEWRLNLAGGLGPALFGGNFGAAFSLRPTVEESVSDYKRLEDACDHNPKGAICNIEGPARLTIRTRKNEASVEAAEGERAVVEIRNSTIYCRNE